MEFILPKNKYRVICKVNRELYPRYSYFKDFHERYEALRFCRWALAFGYAETVKIVRSKSRALVCKGNKVEELIVYLKNNNDLLRFDEKALNDMVWISSFDVPIVDKIRQDEHIKKLADMMAEYWVRYYITEEEK